MLRLTQSLSWKASSECMQRSYDMSPVFSKNTPLILEGVVQDLSYVRISPNASDHYRKSVGQQCRVLSQMSTLPANMWQFQGVYYGD